MSDENVKKSKLYTKTGDKGQTSLYNGERVAKNSDFCQSVGDLDELSSCLGILRNDITEIFWKTGLESLLPLEEREYSKHLSELMKVASLIEYIQSRLLDLGSHVATPRDTTTNEQKLERTDFNTEFITRLEKEIDYYDSQCPKLTNFILPVGSAHLARSVCRRAERSLVPLLQENHISKDAFIFINRLSDLLFALGRFLQIKNGGTEIIYKKH
jgi:cob(I)alamin adenosyltransferase